jgi:hypothetical protein
MPENMDDFMTEYMGEQQQAEPAPAEPAPVEPQPSEDLNAQFEAFKTEMAGQYEQKVANYEKTIQEQQTNLARLEGLVQGAYNNVQAPAPAAPPAPEYTEQDFMRDPMGTLDKVAAARAQAQSDAAIQEFTGQLAPVVNNVIERGYRGELATVANSKKGKRYWKYVEKEVQGLFDKNPQLKAQAGAVEQAFNGVIGQNILELEERISKESAGNGLQPPDTINIPRVAPVPGGRPGSAAPPTEAPKKETALTPEQQRVADKFKAALGGIEWEDSDFLEESR